MIVVALLVWYLRRRRRRRDDFDGSEDKSALLSGDSPRAGDQGGGHQRTATSTSSQLSGSSDWGSADWGSQTVMWSTSSSQRAEQFTPDAIKRATKNFSSKKRLAEGAFGIVYRGKLSDSRRVAIKVLKLEKIEEQKKRAAAAAGADSESGSEPGHESKYSGEASFMREQEVLCQYRHANIVALLGYATGENIERPCLVYEFMAGGSLKDKLRPPNAGSWGPFSSRPTYLNWAERHNIASDIARGLTFLHVIASPPVIHQDVKCSNILLGKSRGAVVAKISDFGTARVAPKLSSDTHVSTTTIVGTGPYMPPEYLVDGQVSEKTDGYAFGVVLLELLTADPPAQSGTRKPLALTMAKALDNPERDLPRLLDRNAGRWPAGKYLALAEIAKRATELRLHKRCEPSEIVDDLDKLAGRRGKAHVRSTEV